MSKKILVAANDQGLLDTLAWRLQHESFTVTTAADAAAVQTKVNSEQPALIVLDLAVPGMDGPSVCRDIRSAVEIFDTPIIALIADSEDSAMVATLNAGANDCMTKPFNPDELVARIKAILRYTAAVQPGHTLRGGPIEMDIARWKLRVDGRLVDLTAKEFQLLRELMQAKGRVLPREMLLQRVWGYSGTQRIDTRTVDVHIARLRHKLGHHGHHIVTVRNVGYRLDIFLDWTTPDTGDSRD